VRHMRMGKSAYQAAIDAADEIGLAVLATTMAIVAVFLPVALMPGISGQFFKAFGFTVVISVLMSLLVARMITPLVAAYFLRSHGVQPHANYKWMDLYLKVLNWSLNTAKAHAYRLRHPGVFGWMKSLFRDHRVYMVGAGFGALLLSGVLFATLPMTFQPPLNLDFSRVNVTLPPGSTLEQTEAIHHRIAVLLKRDPDVEHVFERINVANGHLNVVLKKDRKKTSTEFERLHAPELSAIPDARVSFQSQNGGGPGGDSRDIMLYLGGSDPVQLNAVANQIAKEMATIPELRAPRVGGDLAQPEITIKPHLDLAADLGVTTAALSQTIRIATIGEIEQNAAKFSLSDRQVPITVSLSENARRDISTLENLPVPTTSGGSVPLKAVAEISLGSGPTTIQRTNQIRRTAVGADLVQGAVTGDVWPKINALPMLQHLPQGVQKLNLGDQKWQGELMYYFALALMAGVLLVFAVLVLLYRRFLAPFVNMGSLILAPLGAAIALHVAGQPVSLPVLIGILMLFGIVAKNSILLVDFAVEMMNHGMPKDEAIWEAGHKRAQPIVMTTVAMVAGMLPIALSLSGDASWRAPMGVTVIGGLIFSTLLTLLLVPAYFSIAISIESRIGRLFHRVVGSDAHAVGHAVPAE